MSNCFCKFLAALNFFGAGMMIMCLLFSFIKECNLFLIIVQTVLMVWDLFMGVFHLIEL